MSILEKNCVALEKNNAGLAAKLRSYEGDGIELERAKNGTFTFRYDNRLFHSSYDPEREAAAQVEEIIGRQPDWVVLFGLGCGYLLDLLIEKKQNKVIIFEPCMEILGSVLNSIDLTDSLSLDTVFLSDEMEGVAYFIRNNVDGLEDLLSYQTGPYLVTFPKEFLDFSNRVRNAHIAAQVAIVTDVDSRLPWIDNYMANCDAFVDNPAVDALRDRFKDMPAIIVGAGPSLGKNAHLLKEYRDKVVIIAAITAYKPLLEFGVVPHFLIAAERIDMPEYFTDTETDKEVRLILAEVSHPNLFARNARSKFVFFNAFISLSTEQLSIWGSDYFASIGGSVTTAGLDMGLMFGCDPIVFIGQDLCYIDGKTHVKGGVYQDQFLTIDEENSTVNIEQDYITHDENVNNEVALLWLKGLDGSAVPSKFDWVTFHQWFETYMVFMVKEGMEQKVINATEGGAYIEGMEHTTLADALDRYATKDIELDSIIDSAVKERKTANLPALIKSLVQMRDGLLYIKKQAGQLQKEVGKMKSAYKRSGLTPALIKNTNKIMAREKALFDRTAKAPFLWEALSAYTLELKEHLRDDRPESHKEQFETEVKVIEKTYSEIEEMTVRLLPLFETAIDRMERRQASGATEQEQ
ncbi:MAG: motility associated factor glycosyltransferase family protein [Proteobacteria bacterium]|nr:motility associated factor glycosyltransferase family protein [Pseudomonadota bacterium]